MASDEIILREISSKLSALIAIGLRQLNGDAEFANTSKKETRRWRYGSVLS